MSTLRQHHVISVPRPSLFFTASSSTSMCECKLKNKNGGGLGRRLTFSSFITFVYMAKVFFYLPSFPIEEEDWSVEFPLVIGCRRKYRSKSTYAPLITGVIVTGMIVTPLTLVAGGVLSQQNGKYVVRCRHGDHTKY